LWNASERVHELLGDGDSILRREAVRAGRDDPSVLHGDENVDGLKIVNVPLGVEGGIVEGASPRWKVVVELGEERGVDRAFGFGDERGGEGAGTRALGVAELIYGVLQYSCRERGRRGTERKVRDRERVMARGTETR
jgi:hypothetical protein